MEESLLGKKNLLSVLLEPCMSSFSRGPIPSENLSFRHSSVRKLLFLSENNIIRWINVMFDISNQEEIIREYSENIKEADRRLEVLGSDLDTLETFARENFYFHKADEDLFICK